MSQAGNVYLAEMAPPKYRGTLNMVYQFCVVFTVVVGQLINVGTEKYYSFGWRISLALSAIPALFTLAGGLFLYESPCSLVTMGRHDEGRAVSNSDLSYTFESLSLHLANQYSACVNYMLQLFFWTLRKIFLLELALRAESIALPSMLQASQ